MAPRSRHLPWQRSISAPLTPCPAPRHSPPWGGRGRLGRRAGTSPGPTSVLPSHHLPSSHSVLVGGGRGCQGWKAPPSSPPGPSSLPITWVSRTLCDSGNNSAEARAAKPAEEGAVAQEAAPAGRRAAGSGMQPPSLLLLWLLGSWAGEPGGEAREPGQWKRGHLWRAGAGRASSFEATLGGGELALEGQPAGGSAALCAHQGCGPGVRGLLGWVTGCPPPGSAQ